MLEGILIYLHIFLQAGYPSGMLVKGKINNVKGIHYNQACYNTQKHIENLKNGEFEYKIDTFHDLLYGTFEIVFYELYSFNMISISVGFLKIRHSDLISHNKKLTIQLYDKKYIGMCECFVDQEMITVGSCTLSFSIFSEQNGQLIELETFYDKNLPRHRNIIKFCEKNNLFGGFYSDDRSFFDYNMNSLVRKNYTKLFNELENNGVERVKYNRRPSYIMSDILSETFKNVENKKFSLIDKDSNSYSNKDWRTNTQEIFIGPRNVTEEELKTIERSDLILEQEESDTKKSKFQRYKEEIKSKSEPYQNNNSFDMSSENMESTNISELYSEEKMFPSYLILDNTYFGEEKKINIDQSTTSFF
ncbi:hypothetical protein EDEG_00868 [Edhazardia aedis USNM 41457]|uniref:Uncharacterized protein n=1 Tax=Edhazardia aedis (strain USNM 41457) TaxID=1003232 RepID=J8ZZD6_EDHAE|nr:hypothetical protein EDEG_00868 [Edhazardia aedis USNM 41457]|eukprot:EJW05033.1 hypothetical protein EDEG_00868 [Edhazardia aedis USNM 41457]